jgi:hypothetical protein
MRSAVYASGQSLSSVGIRSTNPDQSLPYSTVVQAVQAAGSEELSGLVAADVVWDTVQSIEPAGVERVYDLTVPELNGERHDRT